MLMKPGGRRGGGGIVTGAQAVGAGRGGTAGRLGGPGLLLELLIHHLGLCVLITKARGGWRRGLGPDNLSEPSSYKTRL